MGIVYRAHDTRLGREVALKILPPALADDPTRRARFQTEARALAALNHPNVAAIYGVEDGALVMELVPGPTLLERIHSSFGGPRPIPLVETLQIARQIAEALEAAHERGITHRDLKPANIKLTPEGVVKLLDFGLAKPTEAGSGDDSDPSIFPTDLQALTVPGMIMGTAGYMAPEQAAGRAVDKRADVWAFGVVLFEMLSCKRLFDGETLTETLADVLRSEIDLRALPSSTPPRLRMLLGRCLERNPKRRLRDIGEARIMLEDLSSSEVAPEQAAPPPSPIPPLQSPRQRSWLWTVAAALVVATAGVWLVKQSAAPPPSQKLAPVTTYPGSQRDPCFSPDGSQVAFSWDGEKGDNFDIYVKLLGETNALRLTTDPAADGHPAWSPDGKRIAFERFGLNGGIYTTSPLGGAEQRLTDFPASGKMSWSPDGKWLAVSPQRIESSGILLLQAEGGEPRQITNPKAPAFDLAPSISRDGRLLAYATCTGSRPTPSCDISVQDLDSAYIPKGSPRRVTNQLISQVNGLAWSRDGESLITDGSLASYSLTYLWRLGIHGQLPSQRIELAGPYATSPSIAATGDHLVFSRNLQDYDIWRYRVGGGMEPFILSSLSDYNPQFSPDGNRIAFESDRSGQAEEIWVARANGGGVVQMTNRLGRHQGTPRWSADGRWIAFDSLGQDGHWHIYVLDASGGRPRRITFERSHEQMPSWSRDGKWIYFRSDRAGRQEIWRVPFAGGSQERITTNGGNAAFESADGKTLFYTKDPASSPLFAKPLPDGPERQVLPEVLRKAFVPVEDGIYYIGRPGEDRKYPLQFFQFSRNTSRLLTQIEGSLFVGLSVSPDRQTILFSKSVSNGYNLMKIEDFQ